MAAVRVEPLSTLEKLCYAVGEISGMMMYNVMSLYSNIFLLEVVQLTPLAATAVVFGSRVWDVLAYPLLLPVLNASEANKWGKYKTWMVASVVVMIPSYMLSWTVPDIDDGAKIAWYLVFYSLFLVAQTASRMAHLILLMYITEKPAERDSATTYRIVCEMMSLILAIVIHGQIVDSFGTTASASCFNSTVTNTSSNSITGPSSTTDPETGYLVSAGTISAATLLLVSVMVFGVKEYAGSVVPGDDTSRGTLLKDIWEVCTFRPFADLVGVVMTSGFATTLQVWSAALMVQYGLGLEEQLQYVMLTYLGFTVLPIPVSGLLSARIGKDVVFAGSILVGSAAAVGLMYVPGRLDVVIVTIILNGAGFAAVFFLPWTMLTDVADDFKIQKGKRRDMLIQTVFSFLDAIANLLAPVTSIVALEIGGYRTGACTQPDTVAFTTRLLVSFMPAGMALFSLVFLWRYQLTGERLKENQAILENRGMQSSDNGITNRTGTDNGNTSGTGTDNGNTNGTRTDNDNTNWTVTENSITNGTGADNGSTIRTEPQPSLGRKSNYLPDKAGPIQLSYFGPYGSFRMKHL